MLAVPLQNNLVLGPYVTWISTVLQQCISAKQSSIISEYI